MLLLNPPLTMVWAWLVFGETLTPLDVLGGSITLVCIYYGSEPAHHKPPLQDSAAGQQEVQLLAKNDDEDA